MLILLAVSFNASAFDFKGIEVGANSSWTDIGNKLGLQCHDNRSGDGGIWCSGETTILGSKADAFVNVDSNSIVNSISITYEPDKFEDIAEVYINKHGKPKISKKVLTTGMGVSVNQVEMEWKSKNKLLFLKKYGDTISEGKLWIVTDDQLKKLQKEIQKQKSDI